RYARAQSQQAVQREAHRIAALSAWKLLRSRSQRGGMRLHRSLQLSLLMRSARELLLEAPAPPPAAAAPQAPRESRKRRGCGPALTELVPTKRPCLWQETPQPQPQGGAFPGLAQGLQTLLRAPGAGGCRGPARGHIMTGATARTVEAF
uniref:Immediate early response 2 n=1 Tax=Leptobrachium leishanense TaxID=445787 RepID=A0A8C5N383_9ANUR